MVVVYDPDGGFVTGGGQIISPVGSYAVDLSLTGKANFGFVSKYQNGASQPTGNTQFKFQVADFSFKSDSYDWLVIANHKAMYKGTGSVNNESNFGFLLSAIDADVSSNPGDVDTFRIKIWDGSTGDVIYDNQMDDAENADATTVVTKGSIKIHN